MGVDPCGVFVMHGDMLALHGPYSIHIISADDQARYCPWEKPHRRLTWYLLVCSLDGEEEIRVEGREYRVPRGGSYLVPPGSLVDLASREGNRPVWVHFEVKADRWRGRHPHAASFASDWGRRRAMAQPGPRDVWGGELPVLVPGVLQRLFASTVPLLVARWKEHLPMAIMESQHLLGGLLLRLAGVAGGAGGGLEGEASLDERIARAEALARENIGASFGVSEFAAAAGYSRGRFSVLYHERTGMPPGEYLRQSRLRQAERLLAESSLTVAEIGRLAGYADPTIFGRFFRRAHKVSPARWREERRGQGRARRHRERRGGDVL